MPAGRYPVVLESGATTNLVQWLGWLAFPGRAYNEERSALSGRLGEQVCSPLVTIVDDPLSPLLPGSPFDPEGTATRRTSLIEAGVAVGIAHDRATGAVAGTGSTGHAMPAPNPNGGVPTHLLMNPGTETLDELVAGLDRGLYVTRFHYTNVVHPVETSITGMTRDGTFLVEDGKIVGGVRNLRFTQSCLDALAGCEAVGAELELATDLFYGAAMAPAVRLSGFTFTSTTAY
jgi:predicted Zn-dependent protease